MTSANLIPLLIKRVMNWDVGPDRIMTGARGWMPRDRFRPEERVADALCPFGRAAQRLRLRQTDSDETFRRQSRFGSIPPEEPYPRFPRGDSAT